MKDRLERNEGLTKRGTLHISLSFPKLFCRYWCEELGCRLVSGSGSGNWRDSILGILSFSLSFSSCSLRSTVNFAVLTSAFFARLSRAAEEKSNSLADQCYYTCKVFSLSQTLSTAQQSLSLVSQSLPFSSIMLFVFASAFLSLKYLLKKYLFR